ncbi:hypothetical protein SUDANB95_02682 [Actinosynnema sp. ALI-1.44]
MEIRLLGPVELHGPAGVVDLGPPLRKCVLAVLAERPGRVVPTLTLIDRVWGGQPPAAARKALHAHVSRLRRALLDAGGGSLVSRDGGYALVVEPDQVDWARYRSAVAAARTAARDGDDQLAAERFRLAARLWRGEPLSGLEGRWAEETRVAVTAQRLSAVEAALEVGMRLGRQAELAGEAAELARHHLERQNLVAMAAQCLYWCGRQEESADLLRRAMEHLLRSGVEPNPRLKGLHTRVLRNDAELAGPFPSPSPPPGDAGARRELVREMRRIWLDRRDVGTRVVLRLREQPEAVWREFARHGVSEFREPGPLVEQSVADLLLNHHNRRLLVLGDKGAGKTTSLIDLAADLLAASDDPAVPVPVILPLSRWHGEDFADWVVDEIRDNYRLAADRVRPLLVDDQVVVLLDGLDEVAADLRGACVRGINAFRTRFGAGLVVTSRTAEYRNLDVRLALANAVVIQPLTVEQIDARLADGGPALAGLRDAVRRDPALLEHLSTPHMLDVVCVAYAQGGEVSPTIGGSYDDYLRALLHRPRTPLPATVRTPPFDFAATRHFLTWLARLMTIRGETTWYSEHLVPASLPGPRPRWPLPATPWSRMAERVGMRRLATAVTCGAVAALLCAVVYGVQLGLGRSAAAGTPLDASPVFAVPLAAAVFGAVTWLLVRDGLPAWLRVPAYTATLMVAGGLHKGVSVGRQAGAAAGWRAGVVGALVYGAVIAASVALALAVVVVVCRLDKDARWTVNHDRITRCTDTAVVCALVVGLSHAPARMAATPHDAAYALTAGFGYGVIMGLGGGVLLGLGFMLVDLDVVRPAARWRMSWRGFATACAAGAVCGVLQWLLLVQAVALVLGPDRGPVFAFVVAMTFCLVFALGHGLRPDTDLPVPAPAKALDASLRAAVGPVACAVLVALVATAPARPAVVEYVKIALVVPAVLAALLTFWFTGGGVWLAHHVTRLIARHARLLPRDLPGFLEHADERMLLHRHGGGYGFRHPEIQRHVAEHTAPTAADLPGKDSTTAPPTSGREPG